MRLDLHLRMKRLEPRFYVQENCLLETRLLRLVKKLNGEPDQNFKPKRAVNQSFLLLPMAAWYLLLLLLNVLFWLRAGLLDGALKARHDESVTAFSLRKEMLADRLNIEKRVHFLCRARLQELVHVREERPVELEELLDLLIRMLILQDLLELRPK